MCESGMSEFDQIKGSWKHSAPWDSDDYLAMYEISGTESNPIVSGIDLNDGEKFEISEVVWRNNELSFTSFMPSAKRKGINTFRLNKQGEITASFTFTVIENLVRENT